MFRFDGSTSWKRLVDMKEAYPLAVAQYAHDNDLISFPVFAWWAPIVLNCKKQVISKLNARYARTTHKYGIEDTKIIEGALEIDNETQTTFWRDAISLEMKDIKPVFQFFG